MEPTGNRARFSRRTVMKGAAASAIAMPMLLRGSGAWAQDVSGTVRLTGGISSPAEEKLLRQVLADFAKAFPKIKVNYEPVPANYLIKIQTDIAAGTVADVFYVQSEYAQDFMSRGVLLELDEFMAKDNVKRSDYYAGLIGAYIWQGKTYGLPKDWSPLAQTYSTQAFTDAGLKAAPADWDELKTMLTTLKAKSGKVALILDAQFERFIMFLLQAGGNVTNKDATKMTLDQPEVLTALDYYYGLYKDKLSSTSADVGAQWPGDAFAKHLAELVFEGNWMFPFLQANAPDLKFACAELPAGPAGKGTPAFTVSYSIFKGTKVPDAAWVLVHYLTGPVGMAKWTSLGLAIPTRPDLVPNWVKEFPIQKPFVESATFATPAQFGPGGQKFITDADAILQSLFAGQIDTKQAQAQLVTAGNNDITLAQPGGTSTGIGAAATPAASPAATPGM